jgi:hypothetical protein
VLEGEAGGRRGVGEGRSSIRRRRSRGRSNITASSNTVSSDTATSLLLEEAVLGAEAGEGGEEREKEKTQMKKQYYCFF